MAPNGRTACPCCIQRAEQMLDLARRRMASALTAAGLAALAILCWSAAGSGGPVNRVILGTAAGVVAAAFIVLPKLARGGRRRSPAQPD